MLLSARPCPAAVYTITADLYKAVWKNMQAKPAKELCTIEGNGLLFSTVAVILVHKSYVIVIDTYDSLVGNSHPVSVLPQVLHHMFGFGQSWLAKHHPWFLPGLPEQRLIAVKQ